MSRERPVAPPSSTPDEQRGRQKIPRGMRERGLRPKEREALALLTGPKLAGFFFGRMNAAGRLTTPRFVRKTVEDAVLEVRMQAEQRSWLSPNARVRRRHHLGRAALKRLWKGQVDHLEPDTRGLNRFERRRRQERLDWAANRKAIDKGAP